jgi:hypothetical protein
MNKGRRIGAVMASAVMALGMAMTVGTAPASAARKASGPKPVSQLLPRVDDNGTTWVEIDFRTDRRACDFRFRLWDNNRVEVHYPNNWSYASLYDDAILERWETDYASVGLEVSNVNRDTATLLFGQITWRWCGTGKWQSKSTGFILPIED